MKPINPEMLRYKPNKFGFNACIFAIVFQCLAFWSIYHCLTFETEIATGLDIVINIVFLLFVFLASEKLKTYDVKWGKIVIGIGIINLLRIWLYLFSPFSSENLVNSIEPFYFYGSIVCYVAVAICLTLGGINTIKKGTILNEFLKTHKED